MDNTREWEWGQKTGVVTQPRHPFSSSVALYYWCEGDSWGRMVGAFGGTHSTKHRHCYCWWSVARIGLSAPFSWRLSSPVACRAHAEQGLVYSSNSATISHNHVIHTNKTCILFAKVSCNNIGSSLSSLSTTILSGYRLVSKADARDGIIWMKV